MAKSKTERTGSERRDMFIAAALTGLIANAKYGDENAYIIADMAIYQADAVMAALETGGGE